MKNNCIEEIKSFNNKRIIKIMKISLAFILGLFFTAFAGNTFSQETKVTLRLGNTTIQKVFDEIERTTSYVFVLPVDIDRKLSRSVRVNAENADVDAVMRDVLRETDLSHRVVGRQIVVYENNRMQDRRQAPQRVRGAVMDDRGNGLPGVTVRIKGSTEGFSTDADGNFNFLLSQYYPNLVLEFTYVGFKKREFPVRNNNVINIRLEEDLLEIDDVVVLGVFSKPKESFTGAAVKITQEELKQSSNRDLIKSISRIDPSFVVLDNNLDGSNPNRLPDIQMRGTTSMPVMSDFQGLMSETLNQPLFVLDGFEISLERVMDLNNDEVESITLLKDASATAIYGSRGSNGVVVITSIKPKKGKLRVAYNTGLNLEVPLLESYNMMNAREKLQFEWDAGLYKSMSDAEDMILKRVYARKLERVSAGVDTDWLSIPTRVGVGTNHWLGISGGDDAFRYSMGLSYNNRVGAMKGSDRSTILGNVNLSYFHKIFRFSNSTSFGFNTANTSPYGNFNTYVQMNPYWEPYDKDGFPVARFEESGNPLYAMPVNNPLYNASLSNYHVNKYTNITNNSSVNITPIPMLQVTLNFSFGKNFSKTDEFISNKSLAYINETDILKKGARNYGEGTSNSWAFNSTVSYAKSFDKHVLTGGLNYEIRESNSENISFGVIGFINDAMNGFNNAYDYRENLPLHTDNLTRHIGYTGTINYNYDNKYYVDASYRSDGASSFGSESRFAPFWSVGAGWTISNEKFMREHVKFINQMRLRYSYGVTGSMNFSPYQALGTYVYQTGGPYRDNITATIRGLENKDLRWQDTYQQNAGIDFGIFNNNVTFSANYYRRITHNAITDMALPLSSGFESYTGNSGKILNYGYDLSASIYVIRDQDRRIFWNFGLGYSTNKNKLLELSQSVKDRMNLLRGRQHAPGMFYVFQEGESVDAIYAVPTVGVDPSTGRLVFVNQDGTQTYDYDVTQRIVVGNRRPTIDLRPRTSFQYKDFSIYLGFTIRSGAQVYNETYGTKIENVQTTVNQDRRVIVNRWTKPGDNSVFTGLNESARFMTDRYVQDEHVFEINSISLSYNFPQSLLKRSGLGLQTLNLHASAGSVLYISTIRQERGTFYPYAFQPTFGFSCSF